MLDMKNTILSANVLYSRQLLIGVLAVGVLGCILTIFRDKFNFSWNSEKEKQRDLRVQQQEEALRALQLEVRGLQSTAPVVPGAVVPGAVVPGVVVPGVVVPAVTPPS